MQAIKFKFVMSGFYDHRTKNLKNLLYAEITPSDELQ